MCTVSFVATASGAIITSNRDEQVTRPALPPEWYTINESKLLFPKDPRAGGTWFATDENANTAVLLNGAKEWHEMRGGYRRSRGLILLDVLSSGSPIDSWDSIDLDNIEPFTIILFFEHNLYQLRWDGTAKENIARNANKNYIWSSSTLYTIENQRNRERRFSGFLNENIAPSEDELFSFHAYRKDEDDDDTESGFIINRGNILKTLSITQNGIYKDKAILRYYDLATANDYTQILML